MIKVPTVHLGGTSRAALQEQFADAAEATVDGVAVYLWSDGYVGWPPLGGRRLRLDQARWLMGEMELYEAAELPALVAVARKPATGTFARTAATGWSCHWASA